MKQLKTCHLIASKKNIRYIKRTIDNGMLIHNQRKANKKEVAYGYSNSNYGGGQDDKRTCKLSFQYD